MKWFKDLYVSDQAATEITKLMDKINNGKLLVGVYVITLASNKNDNLDILNANLLLQKYYKEKEVYIVGVAKSKAECIDLVKRIISDCYKQRNDEKIKEFLAEGFN